jgi:DNA-binding transcriptional MerR regulator
MNATDTQTEPAPQAAPPSQKALTIGAVCKQLEREFPDISISKIRYLEDQKLLSPRRTPGGYRLYTSADVKRLRTILRLQRDEFLPLRVIRQELAMPSGKDWRRRRSRGLAGIEDRLGLDELCKQAGVSVEFVDELESYGLVDPDEGDGEPRYSESDVTVASVCARLQNFGLTPRHLRPFRTGADREAALLEQVVAPALRSRNPERRQGGLEDLEELSGLALELSQLLFWRSLRRVAA